MKKPFPDSFSKNQNWAYFLINRLKCRTVCFYSMSNSRATKILILKWWPLVLNLYKAFSKNKKTFDLVRSRSFSAWFLKKKIFHGTIFWLTKFHWLIAFTSWDIGKYVYFNCCLVCGVINFETKVSFLIKPFFYLIKKSGQNLNI